MSRFDTPPGGAHLDAPLAAVPVLDERVGDLRSGVAPDREAALEVGAGHTGEAGVGRGARVRAGQKAPRLAVPVLDQRPLSRTDVVAPDRINPYSGRRCSGWRSIRWDSGWAGPPTAPVPVQHQRLERRAGRRPADREATRGGGARDTREGRADGAGRARGRRLRPDRAANLPWRAVASVPITMARVAASVTIRPARMLRYRANCIISGETCLTPVLDKTP